MIFSSGDIPIEIDTLDNVIENYKLNPTFLKIDEEGYEERLFIETYQYLLQNNYIETAYTSQCKGFF